MTVETEIQPVNPYKPGAGHMPPHLAGRKQEYREFDRLLAQDTILENLVLTGLRGVGKTVLLETLKPRALAAGWAWAGTDLSESVSVTETTLATRILTDLAVVTGGLILTKPSPPPTGFSTETPKGEQRPVGYGLLIEIFEQTPGLVADKLKAVLEFAHEALVQSGNSGRVVFAYDEAQNLADNAARDEYPLSVLLDVFQSIQRKGVPFMLALTGLPTLFPKLVDARTYAERMFRIVMLDRLSEDESTEAITEPVKDSRLKFTDYGVKQITEEAGGYPYFIQFICREAYDIVMQRETDEINSPIPFDAIQRKLDSDFFAGRWAKVTDRQRQLLYVAASLNTSGSEFTVQEIVAQSKEILAKGFSSSHTNQVLGSLIDHGLVYKNRFGKYSFAVPLLDKFILRNFDTASIADSDG